MLFLVPGQPASEGWMQGLCPGGLAPEPIHITSHSTAVVTCHFKKAKQRDIYKHMRGHLNKCGIMACHIYIYIQYTYRYIYLNICQNYLPSLKGLAQVNQLSVCTLDSDSFFKQPEH